MAARSSLRASSTQLPSSHRDDTAACDAARHIAMSSLELGQESRRPTLYGSRHAIAAGHYLAAAAGFEILEAGGNAVDAGCAAGIALGVLCPCEVQVSGVAPIMIRLAEGKIVTLAGLGGWPKALPADIFMREHGGTIPPGLLQTVVPAAPDAWITALRAYGTMTFTEVAASATRFAREGFSIYDHMAEMLEDDSPGYSQWPSNAEIYLPEGRAPGLGERFVQRDLADMLDYMASEEQRRQSAGRDAGLAAARDAFYVGDIAAQIVKYHKEHGGFLTREDLAAFHTPHEPAVRVRWRDFEVFTCGPWCQGPVLAQSLLMLERIGLPDTGIDDPDYAHSVLEVLKAAFSDREYRYGDPNFVDVGMADLLSSGHVGARVDLIDPTSAYPGLPPPVGADRAHALPPRTGTAPPVAPRDTSYVCVVDRWGNAFSATPSDDPSSSPVIPGTGLVPSNRGVQSRPDPRHPSGVWPGKRPRLTPNPALATRDNGSVFVFGCPGADMQVQAMLQVFLNAFHFQMDIQEAINAPRFSTWSFPNSFSPFEYLPNVVKLETGFPDELTSELVKRGHSVTRWPRFTRFAASVEAIYADADTGFLRAGADPRQPGYAIVS